jgi:hypothetical protein
MVDIARGQFHRHRTTGRLVLVRYASIQTVGTVHVDYTGFRVKGARKSSPTPRTLIVNEYELYRPCRWSLDCHAQAVDVVHHQDHGDIDVCAGCGAEHAEWRSQCAGLPRSRWPYEPNPDCDCPDGDDCRMVVDYCCTHGTPEQRGHEFDSSLAANLAVLAQAAAARDAEVVDLLTKAGADLTAAVTLASRGQDPEFRSAAQRVGYRLGCPGVIENGHGLTASTVHLSGCCDRFAALGPRDQAAVGLRIPTYEWCASDGGAA